MQLWGNSVENPLLDVYNRFYIYYLKGGIDTNLKRTNILKNNASIELLERCRSYTFQEKTMTVI